MILDVYGETKKSVLRPSNSQSYQVPGKGKQAQGDQPEELAATAFDLLKVGGSASAGAWYNGRITSPGRRVNEIMVPSLQFDQGRTIERAKKLLSMPNVATRLGEVWTH